MGFAHGITRLDDGFCFVKRIYGQVPTRYGSDRVGEQVMGMLHAADESFTDALTHLPGTGGFADAHRAIEELRSAVRREIALDDPLRTRNAHALSEEIRSADAGWFPYARHWMETSEQRTVDAANGIIDGATISPEDAALQLHEIVSKPRTDVSRWDTEHAGLLASLPKDIRPPMTKPVAEALQEMGRNHTLPGYNFEFNHVLDRAKVFIDLELMKNDPTFTKDKATELLDTIALASRNEVTSQHVRDLATLQRLPVRIRPDFPRGNWSEHFAAGLRPSNNETAAADHAALQDIAIERRIVADPNFTANVARGLDADTPLPWQYFSALAKNGLTTTKQLGTEPMSLVANAIRKISAEALRTYRMPVQYGTSVSTYVKALTATDDVDRALLDDIASALDLDVARGNGAVQGGYPYFPDLAALNAAAAQADLAAMRRESVSEPIPTW